MRLIFGLTINNTKFTLSVSTILFIFLFLKMKIYFYFRLSFFLYHLHLDKRSRLPVGHRTINWVLWTIFWRFDRYLNTSVVVLHSDKHRFTYFDLETWKEWSISDRTVIELNILTALFGLNFNNITMKEIFVYQIHTCSEIVAAKFIDFPVFLHRLRVS